MHGYWQYAIYDAWRGTWELISGGFKTLMIGGLIFLVGTGCAHVIRGKERSIDWLWDGLFGALGTVVVAGFVFLFFLFGVEPSRVYQQGLKDRSALTNYKSKINDDKTRIDTLSTALLVNKTGANIKLDVNSIDTGGRKIIEDLQKELRATKDELERANARIQASNPKQQVIVSAIATVSIRISMDTPEPRSNYVGSGVGVILAAKGLSDETRLLLASARDHTSDGLGGFGARCELVNTDSPIVGRPVMELASTDIILIEFLPGAIPVGTPVLSGDVVLAINAQIALKFQIPPQNVIAVGENAAVTIQGKNLEDGIQPLTQP